MRLHEKLAWYWFASFKPSPTQKSTCQWDPILTTKFENYFWTKTHATYYDPVLLDYLTVMAKDLRLFFRVSREKLQESAWDALWDFWMDVFEALRLPNRCEKKTDLGICWWMMRLMKHQKTVFNCILSAGTTKTNLSMTQKNYLLIGRITRERNSTKLTYGPICQSEMTNHNLRWLWYVPCSSFVGNSRQASRHKSCWNRL